MVNVSIARRYARALLEVAVEAGVLDKVSEQLGVFAKLVEDNQELNAVLLNPVYTRVQRLAVLDAVVAAAGMEKVLADTLRLMVDRSRVAHLPNLARLFRDLADARIGRVRGKVTTAVPLSAELVSRLEKTLERVTQKNVILEAKVDPSLIGGMSAQVGSMVYDGSIRSQLEDLRRTLKG